MKKLNLQVLDTTFAIHRFQPDTKIPEPLFQEEFFTLVKTPEELSIVCSDQLAFESDKKEPGWRCFKVLGPLDFSLTGILAGLSQVLAASDISIFAVSSFDTDYLLVRSHQYEKAMDVLIQSDYLVHSV